MARLFGQIMGDRGDVHKIANEWLTFVAYYGDRDNPTKCITVRVQWDRNSPTPTIEVQKY